MNILNAWITPEGKVFPTDIGCHDKNTPNGITIAEAESTCIKTVDGYGFVFLPRTITQAQLTKLADYAIARYGSMDAAKQKSTWANTDVDNPWLKILFP